MRTTQQTSLLLNQELNLEKALVFSILDEGDMAEKKEKNEIEVSKQKPLPGFHHRPIFRMPKHNILL